MMFEEIQDGCLVLGNLRYATWMILAISESPCCLNLPSIFCSRGYTVRKKMLVEETKWLFSARQSLIFR